MIVELHLAEEPLALHLLLQNLQRLVDIVVANENLHANLPREILGNGARGYQTRRALSKRLRAGQTYAVPRGLTRV